MGLLKELRQKQEDGTITDEEAKILLDLQKDVDEETPAPVEDDEDKAIDNLATKLADAVMGKVDKGISEMKPATPVIEVKSPRMVVDPQLGEVSIEKLNEVKVSIADRKEKGKTYTEVSKKTIHWLEAVVQNDRQKLQTLVEGTGSRGGYLVPEDFLNMVVEDRRDAAVMRKLATVLPVSTDTFHLPMLASRPQVAWRSEAAVKNTTTVDFGEIVLTPYSLAAIVGLSNELVADAQLGGSIVNLVAGYMGTALAEEEDAAFWTGNGSGKPTGIDNYTFTTIASASTDSARADSVIKAIYALPQGYRSNAVVVANKNTWSKIATLKDNNNNYLLSDLASAASPTLRGLRTFEQNDLVDGKAFIGDFKDYYIADRQGITVDTSTEATVASKSAFESNLTYVRVESRVDGELALTNGIVEVTGLGGA